MKTEFDVFLCHNSQDKPAVRKIALRLKQHGLSPWLDEWELQPGLPWQHVLEHQIASVKAAAVFVGQSGLGPWQDQEAAAFLRQFVKRRCPVIPVILRSCKQPAGLPGFLEGITRVDFRRRTPLPLEQLIWGITGQRRSQPLSNSQPPPHRQRQVTARPHSLIYDSETDGIDGWMYFCTSGAFEESIKHLSSSEHSNGFVLTSFGEESVGLNKPFGTLLGLVEFEYQASFSDIRGENLYVCVIPMRQTNVGDKGLIELGTNTPGDPRNAFSPHRQRLFACSAHVGDQLWHRAQIAFDFRQPHGASYSIFAPRLNEGCATRGAGQLLLRHIRTFGFKK